MSLCRCSVELHGSNHGAPTVNANTPRRMRRLRQNTVLQLRGALECAKASQDLHALLCSALGVCRWPDAAVCEQSIVCIRRRCVCAANMMHAACRATSYSIVRSAATDEHRLMPRTR